jgi:sulfotransferase family protein
MNIALIIGCARSGTSILGELVASHPDVEYIFEPHDIWESAGFGPDGCHRLTAEHATPEVISHIRDWFHRQQADMPLIVDKTPRNTLRVPFVRAVFPEAKIIHIIRDGRDVACSLMPGIGGEDWMHLKPPSWRKLLSNHSGIERCALAWKEVMEIALDDLSEVPHLEVRYEQLLSQPQEISRRLLGYLGLRKHASVTAFCERIRNETGGSYHARHQIRWFTNDHAWRIGRWRQNLNKHQQQSACRVLAALLARLGYE